MVDDAASEARLLALAVVGAVRRLITELRFFVVPVVGLVSVGAAESGFFAKVATRGRGVRPGEADDLRPVAFFTGLSAPAVVALPEAAVVPGRRRRVVAGAVVVVLDFVVVPVVVVEGTFLVVPIFVGALRPVGDFLAGDRVGEVGLFAGDPSLFLGLSDDVDVLTCSVSSSLLGTDLG